MAADQFRDLVMLVLPDQRCYEEFFVKFNIFDAPCLKLLLSKGLGYGIIAGSVMVKLPQILKIIRARSVVGLSLIAFLLEMCAYLFTMSYNIIRGFHFSTWGEAFFVLVQAIIQVALYFYFAYSPVLALVFVPSIVGLAYGLSSGIVPLAIVSSLFASTIPLTALSKVFQIVANFRNGHTGQLSMITSALNFMGTAARIFTTLQEVEDIVVLVSFISASLFNLIIVLQILYYWNVPAVAPEKKVN